MKLLKVTLGVFVLLAMFFFFIRFWGLSRTITQFDSYFFKGLENPIKITYWEQHDLVPNPKAWVLWADVYTGENHQLMVRPFADRNILAKDLPQMSNPTRPLLSELLQKYPDQKWILNIIENEEGIHLKLNDVLKEEKYKTNVVVQSEFHAILTSMKKLLPMMTYGSSQSDWMRFKVYNGMWLLPAAPFDFDVFIAPLATKSVNRSLPLVEDGFAGELHRRGKKLLLGPIETPDELEKAKALGADGFLVVPNLIEKIK